MTSSRPGTWKISVMAPGLMWNQVRSCRASPACFCVLSQNRHCKSLVLFLLQQFFLLHNSTLTSVSAERSPIVGRQKHSLRMLHPFRERHVWFHR